MKYLVHTAPHKKNQGFTLLELLVALVLISIGILGHAKMQIRSMNMAQQASFSQSANSALLDLAQRLKANKAITQAGDFNYDYLNLATGSAPGSSPPLSCITSSSCTKAQFINYELKEWFDNLALPKPRFKISNNGSLFTLQLIWDAARKGNTTSTCSLSTGLQCAEVNLWIR